MQDQLKIKPDLRFPEFNNKYEQTDIASMFSFGRNNSLSRSELSSGGEIANIHYGDIHVRLNSLTDLRNVSTASVKSPKLKYESNEIVNSGDVIIADAAEDYAGIGKTIEVINVNNKTVLSGLHTILLKPRRLKALGYFGYYINTNVIHKQIMRAAVGASVLGISKSNISKIKIQLPEVREQQKITDFLTSVDEKISTLENKLELMQKYKKGIKQQIFSQKIRFKDDNGKDFPEWENKNVNDIFDEINTKTITSNQFPILSSTQDGITMQNKYFKKQTASVDNAGYKRIKRGEFTYRSMSDTGHFTFNIQNIVTEGIVSPAYPVFKAKDGHSNSFYYYYLNNSPSIKKQIFMLKEGGTRLALSYTKFSKLKIASPCHAEQVKIKNLLNSMNEKIEVHKEKFKQAKQFKKALLQRMFV